MAALVVDEFLVATTDINFSYFDVFSYLYEAAKASTRRQNCVFPAS
jgi:hypothetical protein